MGCNVIIDFHMEKNKKCFYWLSEPVWFAASALKCCRLNIVTDKIITNPQVGVFAQQDLASVKSWTMKLEQAQNTLIIAN